MEFFLSKFFNLFPLLMHFKISMKVFLWFLRFFFFWITRFLYIFKFFLLLYILFYLLFLFFSKYLHRSFTSQFLFIKRCIVILKNFYIHFSTFFFHLLQLKALPLIDGSLKDENVHKIFDPFKYKSKGHSLTYFFPIKKHTIIYEDLHEISILIHLVSMLFPLIIFIVHQP